MAGAPPPGQEQGRGGLILVLGILSLLVCALLGPVAWIMGKNDLEKIDRGIMPQDQRGLTQAGKICGMIATILMVVGVVIWIIVIIVSIGAGVANA